MTMRRAEKAGLMGTVVKSCVVAISAMIALALSSQAVGAEAAGAYLANPSVRLWYEETGRLSDNIAPPRTFTLWNTIIGEGDAEEHANDALFTIDVKSDGEQNLAQPLTLSVTDSRGRVLAKRIVTSMLTSETGNVTLALWVRDVGCAGTVDFVAQMGTAKRSAKLSFDCGE